MKKLLFIGILILGTQAFADVANKHFSPEAFKQNYTSQEKTETAISVSSSSPSLEGLWFFILIGLCVIVILYSVDPKKQNFNQIHGHYHPWEHGRYL